MNNPNHTQLLTEEQVQLIMEPTPTQHIEFRPGRGGVSLAYVKISHVIQKLNQVFGFNWSVQHDAPIMLEASSEVIVPTRLVVHFPTEEGSLGIVKAQYGRDDIARNRQGEIVSQGDAIKSAASDGLKKCASLWGMFADVYSGAITIETVRQREGLDETSPPAAPPRSVPPMPEVMMPATAEEGMTLLLEVAQEHFGLEPDQARHVLRQARLRPSQLPGQFTVMLETLREAAATDAVA